MPPPKGDPDGPLQALIIDSWFDSYVGVVSLVRVVNGSMRTGQKIRVWTTGRAHQVDKLGRFTPKSLVAESLDTGEVGFVIAGIKEIDGAPVGDTITLDARPCSEPLPGFKEIKPRVFAGLFPVELRRLRVVPRRAAEAEAQRLGAALRARGLDRARLRLPLRLPRPAAHGHRAGAARARVPARRSSPARRPWSTRCVTTDGEIVNVDNPAKLPPVDKIGELREPIIIANILVPPDYVGPVMKLCLDKRGVQKKLLYLGNQVSMQWELPLAEVVLDFFDRLKSCSRGYASFDYEFDRFQAAPLVQLDILINDDKVDALSIIVHRDSAYQRGRELVDKMQELIPRQMFEVAIQAAIGAHVIARSTVKALRKNVLAKCYGGDISRKRKLLEKQKEGKKRMKQLGPVEIPQEAFLAVLQVGRKECLRLRAD